MTTRLQNATGGQGGDLVITVILGLLLIASAYAIKHNVCVLPIANFNSGKLANDKVNTKMVKTRSVQIILIYSTNGQVLFDCI